MKLQIISYSFVATGLIPLSIQAQTMTDPALAAAIVANKEALQQTYKKRSKLQQDIIKAEAAITVAMTEVHRIESKMLDYLSNASGAVQNLHQIKRAAELVTLEIPRNIGLVGQSMKGNLKGTVIAGIVSKSLRDATAEAAALGPLMAQLVTSGSYKTTDIDGNTTNKKVNLLNAAERYYIANEVVSRLERINLDLFLLAWQIRTLSWSDLFFHLTPQSWYNYMSSVNYVDMIIREYKYLKYY